MGILTRAMKKIVVLLLPFIISCLLGNPPVPPQPRAEDDHPDYNGNTLDNDFSILTLSEAVAFTREVSPACLPSDVSQDFAGQEATVSGWGTLSSGGNQPTVLNEVDVTVTSNADCNSAYGGSITSN